MTAQHTPGVFEAAVYAATKARMHRACAKAMRNGTTVYGRTIANEEHNARLHESTVRRLANQYITKATANARYAATQETK